MAYKIPQTKEESPLADQLRRMSSEQLEITMSNLHTIQPTLGCSVRCYFCGCNVPRGVRAHIPAELVDFFAENFQPQFQLREPYLSGNNDSLDWGSRGKNFIYLYETLTDNETWVTGVSTAVPPGKEELAVRCVEKAYVQRLSISSVNKGRLKKRVPQIFQLARENGVELYYPEKDLLNLGRNSDGEYEADNLSNRVGTIITPLGIYNINLTHPSVRFPTGEIETLIDPRNFRVIEWGRRKDLPIEIWDYWVYGRNGAFPVQLLGEGDREVVDGDVANINLLFRMFYNMGPPGWRHMENYYLDAAQSAMRKLIPKGDLGNVKPSNHASTVRLEKCVAMLNRMTKGLRRKDDHWSRRKRVLLEASLN